MFARHVAAGGDLEEVSRAARALPALTHPPRRADLLLDGLTLLVTDGPTAAAPVLRQATSAFASADIPAAEILRWGRLARAAAEILWDDEGWCLTARHVQLARDVGALDQLPILLPTLAVGAVWRGDFAAAASLMAEADAVGEATGAHVPVSAGILMMLACFRGSQAATSALIEATIERGAAGGQGGILTWAHWAAAVLYNGLGRYADALAAARQASEHRQLNILSLWALPELVEAAVRTGNGGLAGDALSRLAESARAGGTDWGLGTEAGCRALLAEGAAAEPLYQEAIDRLGRTPMRPMLARTHLLYGEWLRRQRRPADARGQLRTACQMLEEIGMEAFAQRGRRELRAVGGTIRKRAVTTTVELTAQEAQIARLAADGLSNPEIGTRLFLSPRTVQFHLRKVFIKLDITSRAQLSRVLSGS